MRIAVLFAATAVALAVAPARAADMPIKAPAQLPIPLTATWTGFYIGGNVGYGWNHSTWTHRTDLSDNLFGLIGWFPAAVDPKGFLGGGQAGFDYQMGSIVFGIQGDFDWSAAKADADCGNDFFLGTPRVLCESKLKWVASLTGRLGTAFGNSLLYVKGGAAWTRHSYDVQLYARPGFNYITGESTDPGWTVGAGLEYRVFGDWTAFVEYDHFDFGTKTVRMNWDASVGPATEVWDIKQQIDAVKAGVNYRFSIGR